MKLFIDIALKRIYLFNIVAWSYRKKIGFPVCKKENFAGLQAHRKRGKSARASPTPHHTLNEERSARFTAQPLSALVDGIHTQNSSALLFWEFVWRWDDGYDKLCCSWKFWAVCQSFLLAASIYSNPSRNLRGSHLKPGAESTNETF